ncbi:DUF1569 domain-containing protein, partial [Acidovorax soli]|uniref:DUF1569 domain-containing protein n=1 Tax=Acidovorax soli TaxID=592050 RepID=UPI0032B2E019
AAASAPVLLSACQGALVDERFASWAGARELVMDLLRGDSQLQHPVWNLPQLLQHLAQSIEYSLQGYPQARSAVFRHTLGRAAFAVFDARGQMSHDLAEPIPGAPPLQADLSLRDSVQRLLDAMQAFAAHRGLLAPHFAYGVLSKAEYQRAHLMHLANHWSQLLLTRATA